MSTNIPRESVRCAQEGEKEKLVLLHTEMGTLIFSMTVGGSVLTHRLVH